MTRMRLLRFAALLLGAWPCAVFAQDVSLCPPTVEQTCYVGYVTAPDKMIVLLSSAVRDPLVNREVNVVVTSGRLTAAPQDDEKLSSEIGSVVMIDAVGGEEIGDARLVFVADPILTALYLVLAKPPH